MFSPIYLVHVGRMKSATLEGLQPLLHVLREHPSLREVRLAEFHLGGRDFVHFHEKSEGVDADLRANTGRLHMPVTTPAQQAEFLERIGDILESLEVHTRDRKRRSRGTPRKPRFSDRP